jgi:chromosome segregation ATPase
MYSEKGAPGPVEQRCCLIEPLVQAARQASQSPDEAWEVSRLQVRCASLAAENDRLRAGLHDAAEATASLQAALRDREDAQRRKASAAVKANMTGMAEAQAQVEKYKGMLHELAASAETLSKDNVVLSTEVMQLRERCREERVQGGALESRVGKLQARRAHLLWSPLRSSRSHRNDVCG